MMLNATLGLIHEKLIFGRRVNVLTAALADRLPKNARVLDVGCGDGSVDRLISERRPDLSIEGIDVLVRDKTHIRVTPFDGTTIPFPDNSFDAVVFVDVLHHTHDPQVLLAEAKRVARDTVVLKDHNMDGVLAETTLRFMDWIGNARHGVALPYNYWPEWKWRRTFDSMGLSVSAWSSAIGLYPWPISLVFDRSLHFIACLSIR